MIDRVLTDSDLHEIPPEYPRDSSAGHKSTPLQQRAEGWQLLVSRIHRVLRRLSSSGFRQFLSTRARTLPAQP